MLSMGHYTDFPDFPLFDKIHSALRFARFLPPRDSVSPGVRSKTTANCDSELGDLERRTGRARPESLTALQLHLDSDSRRQDQRLVTAQSCAKTSYPGPQSGPWRPSNVSLGPAALGPVRLCALAPLASNNVQLSSLQRASCLWSRRGPASLTTQNPLQQYLSLLSTKLGASAAYGGGSGRS